MSAPLSVVFGFCIYLATPIEELIKHICGRTTLVAFRNLHELSVGFPKALNEQFPQRGIRAME